MTGPSRRTALKSGAALGAAALASPPWPSRPARLGWPPSRSRRCG
ncbi:twin-arginine translocation signal domain-containing protein [Caulobacter sp. RL271]|uniref:Twin-arginine translocation signal domain-containing protein n=2 Tax=Caulobacter TaxID=75 RepID=A0ABY5A0N7_9CAUL|nr:twin-arginine translocation signal domain-containing protein [Caulobacter segnis]USQ98320.1 twin-arginine translocation signal domain-containing protein [Caulobacter segnis]